MSIGSPVVREHGPNHRCPIGVECPFRYAAETDTVNSDPVMIPLLERLHDENEYGTIHLPAGYYALLHMLPAIRRMVEASPVKSQTLNRSFGWGSSA